MFFTAESMTTHPALAEAIKLIADTAADHPTVSPVEPYAGLRVHAPGRLGHA